MPLTKLDTTAALIVIDVQKGIVALPAAHPIAEVVERISDLAHAFREWGLPVALVSVTGPPPGRTDVARTAMTPPDDWAELLPELEQRGDDIVITKQRWGAFLGTALDEMLREREVTQVVLAGVATSIGVESTARSAYDLGYDVVLVTDAMTDSSLEAHDYSVRQVFPRLGETDTTEKVLEMLRG